MFKGQASSKIYIMVLSILKGQTSIQRFENSLFPNSIIVISQKGQIKKKIVSLHTAYFPPPSVGLYLAKRLYKVKYYKR